MDPADQHLAHYGVLGMKWGKHKRRPVPVSASRSRSRQNGSKPNASNLTPFSKDAKNALSYQKVAKTKGTQALSNAQLQALVNRQNLERQYSQLNKPQVSNGQKRAERLLMDVGPSLFKAGVGAYRTFNPKAPKAAAIPTSEISSYTAPSAKRVAGSILFAVGKQVLSAYGDDILKAAGKQLIKTLL